MKAKTRAQRRKGGRPPIKDAIRTDSGRISEGKAEMDRRNDNMRETATEARQRVFGISEKDAASQEAGSVLGRLYLDGQLGPVLKKQGTSWFRYEAGNRYASDMARYYTLTGFPHPSPKAQNMFSVRGFDSEITNCGAKKGDPLCGECRNCEVRKAANRMMALEMCLGAADTQGRPVTASVKAVCVMDDEYARGWHPTQIRHLVHGLDALVRFFGLDAS